MADLAVLDPCCGGRMMWFDPQDQRCLFGDRRHESLVVTDRSHHEDGTRALSIHPDCRMDFRALPFADCTFPLVVFDPPHLVRAGPRSWLAAKYGKLHAVHMLNDNEDDSQRHWHGNYGMHFWPTKRQAREEGLRHLLREAKDRASKLRDQLKLADARVKELEAAIEGEASPTPPDPGHEQEGPHG